MQKIKCIRTLLAVMEPHVHLSFGNEFLQTLRIFNTPMITKPPPNRNVLFFSQYLFLMPFSLAEKAKFISYIPSRVSLTSISYTYIRVVNNIEPPVQARIPVVSKWWITRSQRWKTLQVLGVLVQWTVINPSGQHFDPNYWCQPESNIL